MALDFGKLKAGISSKKQTDPRRIFTTLKRDAVKFKRPSDEQGDVLDKWYASRERSNNTIKMNTGSGKTIVGLLCLQSCLNEEVGPAVYVVPDKFLVRQVISEAHSLGIPVTEDERNGDFLSGNAILVINIWKLVNGRSVFGVSQEGVKIPIGSIVIDDAHACLSTVADQFKIKLSAPNPLYETLLGIFEADLEAQSPSLFLDVKANDPSAVMCVPYWAWKDKQKSVLSALHPQRSSDALKWPWPLIKDVLPLCQAAFGNGEIEIAPRFLPIDNIPAFTEARRRIYMTATLADDSILVSHFQAEPKEVADPIRPKNGGDIGDRMILAPQEITPSVTVDEIKLLASTKAKSINVCVIVPSNSRAKYWEDVSDQTLTSENMEEGINRLRSGHVGLTVFVNKYDGVDLPAKACEMLIIDGLPEVNGLIERVEQLYLDGTRRQLVRQIQRIEQGMGRGVRSSEDHCLVLLIGSRLTQRLHDPEARILFSSATAAQLKLGREVAAQVKGKPLSELKAVMDLCLERDGDWVQTSKDAIAAADEAHGGHVDDAVVLLRQAFDCARANRFERAQELAQQAVNGVTERRAKGYLKQQLAEYVHHLNPVEAQKLQSSALDLNRSLLRPIKGISYEKLSATNASQAVSAVAYMKRFLEKNDLLVWVNGLIEDLAWGEENSSQFERAFFDLGLFLGFGSQRPEEHVGRGPDNLWAIGALNYLVIECKSGATKAAAINKHDCNQLNGSMVWFGTQYDNTSTATPVMIHPKTRPEFAATLHEDTRIINEPCLANLLIALRDYAVAIGEKSGFTDVAKVNEQLRHFGLTKDSLIDRYTVKSKQ